jgi:UDP-GlcNAc3NAcA epimerase
MEEKFDAVVVFGDTNSTLAGAIAASKIHIPIVHIEAGLRSFNMSMPEEINRIVCDQLSSLLYAPTQTAINNLTQEGFFTSKLTFPNGKQRNIFLSGDIMYDNMLYYSSMAENKTDILNHLGLTKGEFALATIHRDNNTDNPERLSAIFDALLEITKQFTIKIVIPIHPRTKKLLSLNLSPDIFNKLQKSNSILLIPPASFFEIILLEKNAQVILTDSGGIQKEAYFLQKPSVILRPETEWTEIIEQKAGIIADANKDSIIKAFESLRNSNCSYPSVFGNGQAAEFILEKMIHLLHDSC